MNIKNYLGLLKSKWGKGENILKKVSHLCDSLWNSSFDVCQRQVFSCHQNKCVQYRISCESKRSQRLDGTKSIIVMRRASAPVFTQTHLDFQLQRHHLFVNGKHEDCLPNDHRSFTNDKVLGKSETQIPFVKNPCFFSTNSSLPWVYIILISLIWFKTTKANICNGNNHNRKQADIYFFTLKKCVCLFVCVCVCGYPLHPKTTLTAK